MNIYCKVINDVATYCLDINGWFIAFVIFCLFMGFGILGDMLPRF